MILYLIEALYPDEEFSRNAFAFTNIRSASKAFSEQIREAKTMESWEQPLILLKKYTLRDLTPKELARRMLQDKGFAQQIEILKKWGSPECSN
jgi:hypothetical protein